MAEVKKKKLKDTRKERSLPASKPATPQWGMKNYSPERPDSEDDSSIAAHISWMTAEKRKRQPDFKQVEFCMGQTLSDRRKWLTSESKPTIGEVREKYPWLFDEDQVCLQFFSSE